MSLKLRLEELERDAQELKQLRSDLRVARMFRLLALTDLEVNFDG